jgi:hypothetical protein
MKIDFLKNNYIKLILMALLYQGRWNILTAATNGVAIYPIFLAYKANDMLTVGLIVTAAMASVVSHVLQSHKHGMWGFGISPMISWYLDKMDVVGAMMLVGRIGVMAYKFYFKEHRSIPRTLVLSLILSLGSMLISESDYSARTQTRFLICHNIWHVSIFTLLGMFLSNYYLH